MMVDSVDDTPQSPTAAQKRNSASGARAKKAQGALADLRAKKESWNKQGMRPPSPEAGAGLASPPSRLPPQDPINIDITVEAPPNFNEGEAQGLSHSKPRTRAPTEQDIEELNRELLDIQERLLRADRKERKKLKELAEVKEQERDAAKKKLDWANKVSLKGQAKKQAAAPTMAAPQPPAVQVEPQLDTSKIKTFRSQEERTAYANWVVDEISGLDMEGQ